MNAQNINTADYWNDVYSSEWASGEAESARYRRDYAPIHDAIIRLIPDGSSVLDIACGPGLLCRKIRQRRPDTSVTGVDFSQFVIARNQQRDQGLGVHYRQLDVRNSLALLGGGEHLDADIHKAE